MDANAHGQGPAGVYGGRIPRRLDLAVLLGADDWNRLRPLVFVAVGASVFVSVFVVVYRQNMKK